MHAHEPAHASVISPMQGLEGSAQAEALAGPFLPFFYWGR
jgi:hypothetical protein